MVDHDHDKIKAIDWEKVSDEVHGEVLEGTGALEGKGGDGWDCRMGEDLVCLANCAYRNVFLNVGGKARPPVVLGKKGDGAKMTPMAAFKGTVGGSNQIVVSWFGDIEPSFVVESSIIEGPIISSQSVEEGKFFFHLMDSLKN